MTKQHQIRTAPEKRPSEGELSKRENDNSNGASDPLASESTLYPKLVDDDDDQRQQTTLTADEKNLSLSRSSTSFNAASKRSEKHRKKWNRRMRFLFCCLGNKKNKESIADVASIFAEFFSGLNVPSSDTAAGFVLLSKYQAAQRQWILKNPDMHHLGVHQFLSGVAIKDETEFLDISKADDSHLINDLIYYMNYSLAIFGWPLQVLDDPCMLCCIYPYLRLSPCCSASKKSNKTKSIEQQQQHRRKDEVGQDEKDLKQKSKRGKKSCRKHKSKTNGSDSQPQVNLTSECDESNNNPDAEQSEGSRQKCQRQAFDGATNDEIQNIGRSIPGRLNEDHNMSVILNDNCCGCNSASAERRLAQHNYEIVYISYKSNINVVPFLVAADHSKRTIVVAIRGSMSLSDMITDMNGTVDRVPLDNCPDDWLCHRGITSASVYVKTTLIQERILERAFNCQPDLGSHNYDLVLCGHSLGAGAAAILGVLMRPLYPTLRAYLYSPPGGILSLPVVEYTKEFAIGIILGADTVSRLGVAQMERLRYHTLLSLKSAQKSPGKILTRALCPSMCFGRNQVDYDPEQSVDLLYGTDGRPFDYSNTKIPFQVQPQVLYVPGRLIHVVKNYSFRSKTQRLWSGPIFQAVWTDNTSYDRVLIDEGMFLDHLPQNLMHAMKMLFSRTLPGRRETVKSAPELKTARERNKLATQLPPTCGATATNVQLSQRQDIGVYCVQTSADYERHDSSTDDNNNNNDCLARVKNVIDYDNNNNDDNLNNNNNNATNDSKNTSEIVLNVDSLKSMRK